MGAYADALERFKVYARSTWQGASNAPNITAGFAASMLRYLKDRQEKLGAPLDTPWEPIGRAIVATAIDKLLPPDVAVELWRWAGEVCDQADREGMAFVKVTPNPVIDYGLLRMRFPLAPRPPAPSASPTVTPDADELEAEAKKPKPGPTPGDKANTGLLLIAIIIIAALGHRART